jgi:putative membrane protein
MTDTLTMIHAWVIDALILGYPWIKALHLMAVITWMAGIFYLPRLYVYHAERSQPGDARDDVFQVMESKLLKLIMNPSLIAVWVLGLLLVLTPGIVDWSMVWPWTKGAALIAMTWFHMWLAARRKDFVAGRNRHTGRRYRMMNELPTILMVVIVLSVIVKF